MWIIKVLEKVILEPLFPKRCAVCSKKGVDICEECLSSLTRAVETPHPSIYSYFSYKDSRVKSILQNIKYFRKSYLITPLVKKITTDFWLTNFLGDTKNSLLIPIPMSRKRKLLRGGNQTEAIASSFSSFLSIPFEKNLLLRKKDTSQQVKTHSKGERLHNMKGAFAINNEKLDLYSTARIILIDDVTTTGATVTEAKKILEDVGYRNILTITIAH